MSRKQIALVFNGTYKTWSGGIIYILNIIRCLNLLDEKQKPNLIILYTPEAPVSEIEDIGYPYLQLHLLQSDWISLALNRISRMVLGRNIIPAHLGGFQPQSVFPYQDHLALKNVPRKIYWIPDFQYIHLPQMYQEAEWKKIHERHLNMSRHPNLMVLSSADAKKDYTTHYPKYKNPLFLLRFAQILPDFSHLNIESIKTKYQIIGAYFMAPNQFWKHKNHMAILEAAKILKAKHPDFKIVFTGNESDHRNKDHINTLRQFIIDHELQKHIQFLGFIDRLDQLALMKNALSIIQPSLFEGWSTVVEDSKAVGQYLLLSDIPIHREQVSLNAKFFNPNTPHELASSMAEILEGGIQMKPYHYENDIFAYRNNLCQLFEL